MKRFLVKFANEEFGNAIIDWTVLMAGMVMLSIAVVLTITGNVEAITDDTVEVLETMEVNPA